jgi:hypothetical protein
MVNDSRRRRRTAAGAATLAIALTGAVLGGCENDNVQNSVESLREKAEKIAGQMKRLTRPKARPNRRSTRPSRRPKTSLASRARLQQIADGRLETAAAVQAV